MCARLTPRLEVSPNGNLGTGGRYILLRAFATSIKATGLSILPLPALAMPWARVRYTLGGTAPSIKFQVWGVPSGGGISTACHECHRLDDGEVALPFPLPWPKSCALKSIPFLRCRSTRNCRYQPSTVAGVSFSIAAAPS
jgi:hypothetical protein